MVKICLYAVRFWTNVLENKDIWMSFSDFLGLFVSNEWILCRISASLKVSMPFFSRWCYSITFLFWWCWWKQIFSLKHSQRQWIRTTLTWWLGSDSFHLQSPGSGDKWSCVFLVPQWAPPFITFELLRQNYKQNSRSVYVHKLQDKNRWKR